MGRLIRGSLRPRPMIALDLSRLLSRAGKNTPTGIDRVELAYAEHLIASGDELCFVALSPLNKLGLLPQRAAERFVATTSAEWHGDRHLATHNRGLQHQARRLRLAASAGGEGLLYRRLRSARARPIYLLVSHHHLERHRIIARLKARTSARFVCLIHDLIPIEFPEYAKPGQAKNHLLRIETAIRFGDAFIVNSTATRDALQPHLDRAGHIAEVLAAPFGVDLPPIPRDAEPPIERPYFVYVGTIEARKNHLMLLNIWRRLAAEFGDDAPRLVLIGQRGWETENVVDMLERCPGLRDLVIEHNSMSDREMVRLIRHARALLFPSFAEGFGFPIIEGLGLGVPVISSDIPALRETGGEIPEYLDPLDGLGWHRAILDYAAPHSPRRAAQMQRLADWRPPQWRDHFVLVERLLRVEAGGFATKSL